MKSVILILIDGARYDFVKEDNTYKQLFQNSKWFNRFYTASPYTIGSMHALFTGLYPKNNGVCGYLRPKDLREDVKIIPQYLKEKGYFTLANIPSLVVMANRGFDVYSLHDEYNQDVKEEHLKFIEENQKRLNENRPFFLYLHYSKIHTSLVKNVLNVYSDRSEEYFENREENIKRYKKDIEISGEYLKDIFKKVKEYELDNDTQIWILSDHGASVGEVFGERAYGVFLYNYTLHNFVIKYDSKLREEDNSLRSTVDFLPLLFDSLNIDIPQNIDGILKREIETKNLFSLKRKVFEIYFETGGVDGPFPSPQRHNIFGIFDGKRKLVHIKTIDRFQEFIVENEKDLEVFKISSDLKKKLLEYER